MAIWNILQTSHIFYDHFVFSWYIFSGFGITYQEKSGNPAAVSIVWLSAGDHFSRISMEIEAGKFGRTDEKRKIEKKINFV
jgi:hypothetical protein